MESKVGKKWKWEHEGGEKQKIIVSEYYRSKWGEELLELTFAWVNWNSQKLKMLEMDVKKSIYLAVSKSGLWA